MQPSCRATTRQFMCRTRNMSEVQPGQQWHRPQSGGMVHQLDWHLGTEGMYHVLLLLVVHNLSHLH